jgi:hypothetical protein
MNVSLFRICKKLEKCIIPYIELEYLASAIMWVYGYVQ